MLLMHPTQRLLSGRYLCGQCLAMGHAALHEPLPNLLDPVPSEAPRVVVMGQPSPLGLPRMPSATGAALQRLSARLTPAENMLTGTLPNGLSYVILPNLNPADKFVTYLQVFDGGRDRAGGWGAADGWGGRGMGVPGARPPLGVCRCGVARLRRSAATALHFHAAYERVTASQCGPVRRQTVDRE